MTLEVTFSVVCERINKWSKDQSNVINVQHSCTKVIICQSSSSSCSFCLQIGRYFTISRIVDLVERHVESLQITVTFIIATIFCVFIIWAQLGGLLPEKWTKTLGCRLRSCLK